MNRSDGFGDGGTQISRRLFTACVAALAAAPRAFAQSASIRLRKLHCFEIAVPDIDKSVAFYQGLFGMPVQARSADRVCLRIGAGPQFMSLRRIRDGEAPSITHLGYSVEDFEAHRVLAVLGTFGFAEIAPPPVTSVGLEHPMSAWIRMHGETPELFFSDARGLIVHLAGAAYCGGS